MSRCDSDDLDPIDVLRRKYTLGVLEKVAGGATASEIVDEAGIPQATVYRRLNNLEDVGIVEVVHHEQGSGGQMAKVYTLTAEGAYFDFGDGTLSLEGEPEPVSE